MTTTFENYRKLAEIISKEYSHILKSYDYLISGTNRVQKLRLTLINNAIVDIFFSQTGKYSFHYESEDNIYRHDNSPYHPSIKTFPKHCHNNDIIEESYLSDDIFTAALEFCSLIEQKFI